jgi:2-polyprenyl-3-methyl-5-hydroxy-6-metoxy-1,4-benzoquinol methylase
MSHQDDIVIGNVYDKYATPNPVARWMMRRFLAGVVELALSVRPRRVLEVGCGEGYLARELLAAGLEPDLFVASDISLARIAGDRPPVIHLNEASVSGLPHAPVSFDLVVCCEVLEHVENPEEGLRELARVGKSVLVSTPWEPLWRILNVLRGRYLRALGNTPGHVQHFSRRGLLQLARSELRVEAVRTPIPWTIVLGRSRRLVEATRVEDRPRSCPVC